MKHATNVGNALKDFEDELDTLFKEDEYAYVITVNRVKVGRGGPAAKMYGIHVNVINNEFVSRPFASVDDALKDVMTKIEALVKA